MWNNNKRKEKRKKKENTYGSTYMGCASVVVQWCLIYFNKNKEKDKIASLRKSNYIIKIENQTVFFMLVPKQSSLFLIYNKYCTTCNK